MTLPPFLLDAFSDFKLPIKNEIDAEGSVALSEEYLSPPCGPFLQEERELLKNGLPDPLADLEGHQKVHKLVKPSLCLCKAYPLEVFLTQNCNVGCALRDDGGCSLETFIAMHESELTEAETGTQTSCLFQVL